MLGILGLVGAAHSGIGFGFGIALSLVAVGIVISTVRYKNSGILRYGFGSGGFQGENPAPVPFAAPQVIQVLGAGADVLTPDDDNQLFGGSPGHDQVLPFDGAGVLQQQPTQVLVANPTGVQAGVGFTHTAPTHYIPSGTKVTAYFVHTDPASGAIPVVVRTQVAESRIRRGANGNGNNVADAAGDFFLAALRVSVQSIGIAGAFGMLVIELQHSEHDITGNDTQDQQFAPIPPP